MKMKELNEMIELSEGNFLSKRKLNKILKEETPSELRERGRNLRLHLNKMETLPFESPQEKINRRKPLKQLLDRISKVIQEKEAKMKTSQIENIQEWAKNEVPLHFIGIRVLRYGTGTEVDGLRKGIYRLDHVKWLPLTDENITIKTRSGRTLKFNLLETISPRDWKDILTTPLTPKIYNIERGVVGLKDGKKPTSYWDHPVDYKEQQKIKPVLFPTYLAIMSV